MEDLNEVRLISNASAALHLLIHDGPISSVDMSCGCIQSPEGNFLKGKKNRV